MSAMDMKADHFQKKDTTKTVQKVRRRSWNETWIGRKFLSFSLLSSAVCTEMQVASYSLP